MSLSKRSLLLSSFGIGGAVIAAAYGGGTYSKANIPPAPLKDLADELSALSNKTWKSETSWKPQQVFQRTLKPHFAYGALTKNEFSWAHWMHIKNHLEALKT
jgi:hypothetical protein